ncbi:hypothetical protein FOZ63_002303 [Perkinsus olseni]|uniref:Uncharacterized protein n=1 Tax=Perkinsus olseni TaxID=32597 RepID=A0A7J6Q3W8_PEROL|nr:hypothetical protein FOZ63_002303 [Perkinsus olseni]
MSDFVYVPPPKRFPPPLPRAELRPSRPSSTYLSAYNEQGKRVSQPYRYEQGKRVSHPYRYADEQESTSRGELRLARSSSPSIPRRNPSGSSRMPTTEPLDNVSVSERRRDDEDDGRVLCLSLFTTNWSPEVSALYDLFRSRYACTAMIWEPWFGNPPALVSPYDQITVRDYCSRWCLALPQGLRDAPAIDLVDCNGQGPVRRRPQGAQEQAQVSGQHVVRLSPAPGHVQGDPTMEIMPSPVRREPSSPPCSASIMSVGSRAELSEPCVRTATSATDHEVVSFMSSPSGLHSARSVKSSIPLGVSQALGRVGISIPESPPFELNYNHNYSYLIPRFPAQAFHDRYDWLWKWSLSEDDRDLRSWRKAIESARPVLGTTCYEHLNRPYGVSHATVAGLWDKDLLDAPIAGRVLFVSGLLSGPKRFSDDDLYLPCPSALLRWVQSAGVETGRQSGLSVAETQFAQLLALNKAKAVTQALDEYALERGTTVGNYKALGKYLPDPFIVRNDEWVATSPEEVAKAHRSEPVCGRPTAYTFGGVTIDSLNEFYRRLPESAEDATKALSSIGQQYRVKTADGLRPLRDER